MALFDDALAAARDSVQATYARPMTFMAMSAVTKYKPAGPDPDRPPLTIDGVLHDFAVGRRGQSQVVERSDGGRPGGRFGFDLSAASVRISVDDDDLAGWAPAVGTRIVALSRFAGDPSRTFDVTQTLPPNGGRRILYVTEVAS